MSNENYEDAEKCGSYLVFRRRHDFLATDEAAICNQELQNGLAALHIVKPVHTLGFKFHCEQWNGSLLSLKSADHRPVINPGQWARMQYFDDYLQEAVPAMIARVRKAMNSSNVEQKNCITADELRGLPVLGMLSSFSSEFACVWLLRKFQ
jgi:hypothetical protein